MKKCSVFFLLVLLVCAAVQAAFAAGTVSFSLDSVTCQNNRLIEISCRAQSGEKLSAALFRFVFDKSVLEFRGAKAPQDSRVEAAETDSGCNVSYLCAYGADISGNAAIFTLQFKSIGEGTAAINYSVENCVSADVEQMTVGSCTGGTVTVTGKTSAAVSANGQTKQSSAAKPQSSKSGGKSKTSKASRQTETVAETTIKEMGYLPAFTQEEWDFILPLVILCASLIVGTFFVCSLISHFQKKSKDHSDSD